MQVAFAPAAFAALHRIVPPPVIRTWKARCSPPSIHLLVSPNLARAILCPPPASSTSLSGWLPSLLSISFPSLCCIRFHFPSRCSSILVSLPLLHSHPNGAVLAAFELSSSAAFALSFPSPSPCQLACIMASLLDCGICPRKPTFTDISHLLTHIGSKAHLAVLHKLHIKSHQELAAGIQLTAYNQWFEHHGLAQLLSDRMQQKERKQAAKRAGTRPKRAVKPAVQVAELPSSPVRQTPRGKGRGRSRRAKHHTDAFETGTSG